MKKYKDERINYLLEQLQEDIKLDDESSYRDIECDLNELYKNIDKVVDYTNGGCKGNLYLNSNLWEICRYTLSQILKLYDLKFIGSDKVTERERVIKINENNKELFKTRLLGSMRYKTERSR